MLSTEIRKTRQNETKYDVAGLILDIKILIAFRHL